MEEKPCIFEQFYCAAKGGNDLQGRGGELSVGTEQATEKLEILGQ
jgi:hypothetical protein